MPISSEREHIGKVNRLGVRKSRGEGTKDSELNARHDGKLNLNIEWEPSEKNTPTVKQGYRRMGIGETSSRSCYV